MAATNIFIGFCLLMAVITVTTLEVDEDILKAILDKVESLELQVNTLKDKNVALEEEVNFLKGNHKKRLLMSPELPVTFTARIQNVIGHTNPGDVITFPDIWTNYGGGFNNNTSMFVAPMAGIYLFSCSLLDHMARSDGSGTMLHADIVKKGMVLGRVFAHAQGSSYRDQGAQTVFVELQVGDKVWVRNYDSPDLSVGGETYSTFSGYLLWPME